MQVRGKICLILFLLTMTLTGCSRTIGVHLITPDDFFVIEAGTKVNDYTTVKEGYFFSEHARQEILKAELEAK